MEFKRIERFKLKAIYRASVAMTEVSRLSKYRDTRLDCIYRNSEIHLNAKIEEVWRNTVCVPHSYFRDTFGAKTCANWILDGVIEGVLSGSG